METLGTLSKDEGYDITSQMRRSAISYRTSIAKGAAWHSKKEFVEHVRWNDPAFVILWPVDRKVISDRDLGYPDFVPLESNKI